MDSKIKRKLNELSQKTEKDMEEWLDALSKNSYKMSKPIGVAKIYTSNESIYYTNNGGITALEHNQLKLFIGKYIAEVKDLVDEVDIVANETHKKQKSLYAELISLMGIFVALFSLIVINVNMLQSIIDKTAKEIAFICVTVNGCTIGVILIAVLLIRWLLIKPLKK